MRNREIGFIFQTFHLIPDLSVADNVEIPLLYRRMAGSERRKLALAALERVGLASRMHHFPSQLSGGQQQRVAIARAIVGNPRILLADEPTGNLDSQMGDEIMHILHGLRKDSGTTIVMVTHDPRLAEQTSASCGCSTAAGAVGRLGLGFGNRRDGLSTALLLATATDRCSRAT